MFIRVLNVKQGCQLFILLELPNINIVNFHLDGLDGTELQADKCWVPYVFLVT